MGQQDILKTNFFSALSECRENGEFTDLILRHERGDYRVHKVIVCSQSKVLYKGCTTGFKESSTSVYEMIGISLLELEKLVDFCYRMDYVDDLGEADNQRGETCDSILTLHARMFAHGDRYDIPALREVAARKYSTRCSKSWDPVEFLGSISEVYGSTHDSLRQLRDIVTRVSRNRLPMTLSDSNIATVYDEVTRNVPDYTRELLGLYMNEPLYLFCRECRGYQGMEALQTKCKKCGKGGTARAAPHDIWDG